MSSTITLPELFPETSVDSVTETNTKTKYLPTYNVVCFNCNCHSFEEVISAFQKVLGKSMEDAIALAVRIHREGQAVVISTNLEAAEHYAVQIEHETFNEFGPLNVEVVPTL
jgi:ATP-dependent Clp protease adapter protein ClpS